MTEKQQKKQLTQWLKSQSIIEKRWLHRILLLGILNGLVLIAIAWLIASLLHAFIIEHRSPQSLFSYFILLFVLFIVRAFIVWGKEKLSFIFARRIRQQIRTKVLDRIQKLGPAWIQNKPIGYWNTIIIEQIENMQDYYARYLPQMLLAGVIPLLILISVFPINWAAGLILLITAPLIPIFMALVGMGAADANKRNFQALGRLSGNFLDRLRGLETIRLFYHGKQEIAQIRQASDEFRQKTMEVLRLAFLSSGVLEFFTSVSIAVVAVYFGFSYLGKLHFGSYGLGVTLFSGFVVLILAPEYFQPLRDLGTFYHAKAQALGAAETLHTFITETEALQSTQATHWPFAKLAHQPFTIEAKQWQVTTSQGLPLLGPIDFIIHPGQRIAIVGRSGSGKTSLLNGLLGFLPYQGSLTINGAELNTLNLAQWHKQLNWVGQNPNLSENTIRRNVMLANPQASDDQFNAALEQAYVSEFLSQLPNGVDAEIGEDASYLSVGQAQRIAVARALLKPTSILLLDEPTASLDSRSEKLVRETLSNMSQQQTTIHVTHRLHGLENFDLIWVIAHGKLIQQGSYDSLSQAEGIFQQWLRAKDEFSIE